MQGVAWRAGAEAPQIARGAGVRAHARACTVRLGFCSAACLLAVAVNDPALRPVRLCPHGCSPCQTPAPLHLSSSWPAPQRGALAPAQQALAGAAPAASGAAAAAGEAPGGRASRSGSPQPAEPAALGSAWYRGEREKILVSLQPGRSQARRPRAARASNGGSALRPGALVPTASCVCVKLHAA